MKLARTIVLGVLGGVPLASHAYTTNGWWDQDVVGMYASNTSFPSGSPFRAGISEAFDLFNRNPSQFRVNDHYGDNSVSRANFESEIWASADWDWEPNELAVELSRYGTGGKIIASDILFNANVNNWTTSDDATDLSAYGGSGLSFEAVLLHELGHTAGLGHENDEYTIMGEADWHLHRWQGRALPYMGEDASDGLVAIYGRRSGESIEDLSVAHFRWVGAYGEYSDHFRTKVFTPAGVELSFQAFSGMRRYDVFRNQTVDVEFTYENNGETDQTGIAVGFYVSTDDLVTTGDRLIGTATFNLSRGDVSTRVDRLTIPGDLAPGQTYYLGVVLDRTSELPEIDEDNNRAFHIIRVF